MPPAPPRTASRRRPGLARGFTLIEMLIVVALVGILATMALPSYRESTIKARESVLRHDLWVLRDVIDQFYTDKARYPSSLDELVSTGYIRSIPVDPFTKASDTWIVSYEPLAEDAEEDVETEPGITDVSSGAEGVGLDGTPYSEW